MVVAITGPMLVANDSPSHQPIERLDGQSAWVLGGGAPTEQDVLLRVAHGRRAPELQKQRLARGDEAARVLAPPVALFENGYWRRPSVSSNVTGPVAL